MENHSINYKQSVTYLILANSISGFSQGITMIAIPWYINVSLGLQKEFGIFYAAITIVSTIWGLYAGTLIDRYSRKSIQIYQNVVGAILLSSFGIISYLYPQSAVILSFAAFMTTIFIFNIHYPNFFALIQEVIPKEKNEKFISTIEIINQTNNVLGGIVAGVLLSGLSFPFINLYFIKFHIPITISPWSISQIVMLDGFTYFLAVLISLKIDYTMTYMREAHTTILDKLQFAWKFLKNDMALTVFGWFSFGIFVTIILNTYYLASNYISLFLKASVSVFAKQEIFFAIGAIFAGILARNIFRKKSYVVRILFMFLLAILVYFVYSINKSVLVYYIMTFILGYSNASTRIYRISYIFEKVPNALMGRVSSFFSLSSYIFRAILSLIFALPFFVGKSGIQRVMLFLAGFLCICFCLIYYFHLFRKK